MEKFINLISSRRWWFIALIAILTGFFGYNASRVKTDNSIEIWLKQDDPALIFYNKFKKDFGNEEFLLITIDDEDIFSADNIRLISRISSGLEKLKGVTSVTSISSILKLKINAPYFKELLNKSRPLTPNKENNARNNTLYVLRQELLTDPVYVNNIISKDGKTTAIVVMVEWDVSGNKQGAELANKLNSSEFRKELVTNIKNIISNNLQDDQKVETYSNDKESFPQTSISQFSLSASPLRGYPHIHIAGPTAINAELDKMSQKDMAMFVPLMFGIAVIVLIILFRKTTSVILPMAAIGISSIWTMGLYSACGNTMNMVSGIMTPVIFVIALATSIHIINYYYDNDEISGGSSDRKSITDTIKIIGVPCFFTCFTTALGFLSLMTSDVSPVKITGGFTAAGIMIAFFISTVLITITFTILPHKYRKQRKPYNSRQRKQIFHGLLMKINSLVCDRTRSVLICCIVLIAISIYGILSLKVESDIIKAFPEDSEIIVANNHIEKQLTGLLPLEIVASSTGNEAITDSRILNNIETFQEFLKSINEVTFSLSIVDIIKKVNQTINNGDSRYYKIPDSHEKAGTYLNMASIYGSGIVDNFYTPDQTAARISIRMKQVGSDRYSSILDRINNYIANNLPKYMSMEITGVVHLLIKMQDYLLESQIKTFSLAFVIIFVVMICLLRSIKLALISMIPNITPIILTIGAMGYMGIKLDAGTIMVASVAIGIAVDDTIHFLYRFKQEFNNVLKQRVGSHSCSTPDSTSNLNTDTRNDYIVSIGQTFRHVGRPIIFTSIIAFCGFLALCLSQFKPIQYFGLLTAVTMVSALIADLLILPCCLLVFRPMRKADNGIY